MRSFLTGKELHTEHFAIKTQPGPTGDPASRNREGITPTFDFVLEHSAFLHRTNSDRQALPGPIFTYNSNSFNKEKQL